MEPFEILRGIAAPFNRVNVDTDLIIPKQYLKTIKRTGLGKYLFAELRYDDHDKPNPHFVLNQPDFQKSVILVAGENFGCGSSREHAPWALRDFGIRCIIAASFADIFYNNCFKSGILPIILPHEHVQQLMKDSDTCRNQAFSVDLPNQIVVSPSGATVPFDVAPDRKLALIEGLDDIGLTLKHQGEIDHFTDADRQKRPWVYQLMKEA